MKTKLHYLLLTLVLCLLALGVQAQNLTEFDKEQIVRRATLKMDEFEELLFLISDPTRSRGAVDRYILSSYSREDSLFNQVFYDQDVIIEDDLSPIELTQDNIEVSAIDVVTYLNNFKLQYKKYMEKTVFFTDLSFSEVMQEDYVYVVASYQSEFKGKHANYEDHQYPLVKRKATLRATYDYTSDAWKVWIAGVNFDREGAKPEERIAVSEQNSSEDIKTDEENLAIVQEDQPAEESTPAELQNDQNLPSLQFTSDIAQSIKRGKSMALRWNKPVEDASMSLYQGEQEIMRLQEDVDGQQWNWKVAQKPGKNYSIMLYDPATTSKVKSKAFQIKPKFPLAVKIAVPVVAMSTALWATNFKNENGYWPWGKKPAPDFIIDFEPHVPGGN